MSAPSLRNIMQTSQREFAGAKVVIIFEIHKKNLYFLAYVQFLLYFCSPNGANDRYTATDYAMQSVGGDGKDVHAGGIFYRSVAFGRGLSLDSCHYVHQQGHGGDERAYFDVFIRPFARRGE